MEFVLHYCVVSIFVNSTFDHIWAICLEAIMKIDCRRQSCNYGELNFRCQRSKYWICKLDQGDLQRVLRNTSHTKLRGEKERKSNLYWSWEFNKRNVLAKATPRLQKAWGIDARWEKREKPKIKEHKPILKFDLIEKEGFSLHPTCGIVDGSPLKTILLP